MHATHIAVRIVAERHIGIHQAGSDSWANGLATANKPGQHYARRENGAHTLFATAINTGLGCISMHRAGRVAIVVFLRRKPLLVVADWVLEPSELPISDLDTPCR